MRRMVERLLAWCASESLPPLLDNIVCLFPRIVAAPSSAGDQYASAWLLLLGLPALTAPASMYMFNADGPSPNATLTWVAFGTVAGWAAGGTPAVSVAAVPGTTNAVKLSLPIVSSAMSAITLDAPMSTWNEGGFALQLYTQYGGVVSAPDSSPFFGVVVHPDGRRTTLDLVEGANSSGYVVANFTPSISGMHQVLARHATQGLTSQSIALLAYSDTLATAQGGFSVSPPAILQPSDASMVTAVVIGPLTGGFINTAAPTCTSVWTADLYGNLVSTWDVVGALGFVSTCIETTTVPNAPPPNPDFLWLCRRWRW